MFHSREELFDCSLGGNSTENEMSHLVGNMVYAIVGAVLKVFFRYRVENREAVRAFKGKGLVLVANHTSYLDVAFLWCAIRPSQWVRLMARDSLFETAGGLGGQIIARVGAFPVKRDTADRTSIKRAARMLKNGELVGIFPEGTRRGKGSLQPELHAGAALVARMGGAPMLPCTVRDAENIKQKGQRIRFPQVSIAFGSPIELSWFDFLPKDQRLEACTWYAMRESFALSRKVAPEEVDMVELFPHAFDYTATFAEHPVGPAADSKTAPVVQDDSLPVDASTPVPQDVSQPVDVPANAAQMSEGEQA